MSIQLPETLVAFVTTHGLIPLKGYEADTFRIPEGMTLTRYSEAIPGVCNVGTEFEATVAASKIANAFKDTSRSPEDILRSLEPQFTKTRQNIIGILKGEIPDENRRQYLQFKDRPRNIVTFQAGQETINKEFLKRAHEGVSSAYDFKFNLLNVPGQPDLLRYLSLGKTGPLTRSNAPWDIGRLDLAYIMDFLKSRGVKHLVLIDYTCANFVDDTNNSDPRTTRQARRRTLQEGLGKKTRRPKRKTKTRRGKKRTTQWKH